MFMKMTLVIKPLATMMESQISFFIEFLIYIITKFEITIDKIQFFQCAPDEEMDDEDDDEEPTLR